MNYIVEKELRNFEFWPGARDNAAMLTTDELDKLDEILSDEDLIMKPLTETLINDLFWFDFEYICELLGYQYDIDKNIIVREPF